MPDPVIDPQLRERLERYFEGEVRLAAVPARAAADRARAAAEERTRRPRAGALLGLPVAALVSGLVLMVVAILVLVRPQGPHLGPDATGAAGSGSAGSGAAIVSPTAAGPAAFDADGVPLVISGEPVLRGSAIAARARSGDTAPFLVAGWRTQDPEATCAPSPVHCGYTSLVDAPGALATGEITLDSPGGTSYRFGYGAGWVGGFNILRVRAACTYGRSTCLVVDAEIPPSGAVPIDPNGYDEDGVPTVVDGQPVYRGTAIADHLRRVGGSPTMYVAGWPAPAVPLVPTACTEPGNWETGYCDVVELTDPSRGITGGTNAVLVTGSWYTEHENREPWASGDWWSGGFIVLRVDGEMRDDRAYLHVLGAVGPAAATPRPTREPTPVPTGQSLGFTGSRVSEVDGQPVRWGPQIERYLGTRPDRTFLVTGAVESRPCPKCELGLYPVLAEPPLPGVPDRGTAFPLLRPGGRWFRLAANMIWHAGDTDGVVVLVVRPFTGACPTGADCDGALVVEDVIAPRNP